MRARGCNPRWQDGAGSLSSNHTLSSAMNALPRGAENSMQCRERSYQVDVSSSIVLASSPTTSIHPWLANPSRRLRDLSRHDSAASGNALTTSNAQRNAVWKRTDHANAQRSAAGWVRARDRLHGRVVDRRPVVEMAPPYMLDTVVNGRAPDPAPRRQRACPRSPPEGAPARVSAFSYKEW